MRYLTFLKKNKHFFLALSLVFAVGLYPLLASDKVALFLKINRLHHPLLDRLFYYVTFLGSSPIYLLLITTLAIKKRDRHTFLLGLVSFGCMSFVVQGMKRILFAHQLRPILLIPTDTPLHLVEGIKHHTHLSFPSGHAATIFAVACLVQLKSSRKSYGRSLLLLLGAATVAYSRVYLCQHFYQDIYVGALVGTLTTTSTYAVLKDWQDPDKLVQKLIASWLAKLRRKAQ